LRKEGGKTALGPCGQKLGQNGEPGYHYPGKEIALGGTGRMWWRKKGGKTITGGTNETRRAGKPERTREKKTKNGKQPY